MQNATSGENQTQRIGTNTSHQLLTTAVDGLVRFRFAATGSGHPAVINLELLYILDNFSDKSEDICLTAKTLGYLAVLGQ